MVLREVIRAGNIKHIRELLARAANAVTEDDLVEALCDAACFGKLEIVQVLLEHVDINATSKVSGDRPLHAAVSCNALYTIKYLVEHGADINAPNAFGRTPLQYALDKEITGTLDFSAELGVFVPPNGQASALLIGLGADINARNEHGLTPLDDALYYDHLWAIRLLREHGGIEGSAPQTGAPEKP